MSDKQFFDNPALSELAGLLYQLELAMQSGGCESPEADDLRERMEGPGANLSREEVDVIKGISADLYSLSDPPHEHLPMPENVSNELDRLPELLRSKQYHRALDLLRKHEKYITPARLAFHRGKVWKEIGEAEIADDFFGLAWKYVDLDPDDISPSFSALIEIDPQLARSEAEKIVLHRNNENPIKVLTALDVLVQIHHQFGEAEAGFGLDSFPSIYEEMIRRLPSFGVNPNWLAGVFFFMGFCREELGQTEQALDAYNRGLEIAPINSILLRADVCSTRSIPIGPCATFNKRFPIIKSNSYLIIFWLIARLSRIDLRNASAYAKKRRDMFPQIKKMPI